MKRETSLLRPACFGLFLLFAIACGLVWGTYQIIHRSEIEFGPPSPHIRLTQRLQIGLQMLWQSTTLTQAVNPTGEDRLFKIDIGESIPEIAARLESDGLISDARVFRLYLIYAGLDTTLQAGEYQISPAMTPLAIARKLQDATPSEVTFTILAGWRLEEIVASIPTSGLGFSPSIFLQASHSSQADYPFISQIPAGATLEGFLFPDTYQFSRQASATEVIDTILDNFAAQITPEIQQGFAQQGLNIYQAVILASIVQREAVVTDEMPLIASVFLNRLVIDMPLEADSTVQYALGYNKSKETWWTNPLSLTNLQVNSLYNTYRQTGLPPGPIANPGLSALRAVAFPAKTPYYYFRSACDGSGKHSFSETFDQHMENACP